MDNGPERGVRAPEREIHDLSNTQLTRTIASFGARLQFELETAASNVEVLANAGKLNQEEVK